MKAKEDKLAYHTPEISVLLLQKDAIFCQSDLNYGNEGDPGTNPDWGDDFTF